ncbi:MAG: phosphoribosylformylglycinamidine synthase I [Pirellulaceae bacterium]|jgi:phosphoribosylformylglycinamidine synthase|nr:phosphoribosylformylglycinamidine synthase I [Pirellulaceae bacterium]
MPTPRILILRAPGTNCDRETAFAFEQAGGQADLVHINRLLEDPQLPDRYQVLCLPGGFSYGDDVAAGRILANQIRHHLAEAFTRFKEAGKLILGICNGFQVLLKSGVLIPDDPVDGPSATLTWNDSGRFEARWSYLVTAPAHACVFLAGIERLYLPIAHAEGKFVARSPDILRQLGAQGRLVLRYGTPQGVPTDVPLSFPDNPNGSEANVAGVADATGRVFGLMPHPERHIHRLQHPRWTRGEGQEPGDGLAVFRNAVRYFGL